ncbi:MAG: YfhO family protein, partial [Candidatus Stahlbacteria bacterium]|nr:YfhO family protein [Candidatus Stahlbacteria bacterium]
ENKNQILKIKLLASVFIVVVCFALVCSVGRESVLSFLSSHSPSIQKAEALVKNYPYFLHGLGVAVFLIALNSILIMSITKIKRYLWIAIAALILIIDQWSIEKKFFKVVEHPKKYYAQDEVVNFLARDTKNLYRVFPLYYEHTQDAYLALHGIQSIGGYVSNPGERYQKFIGAGESVMFTPSNLVRYKTLLDILNVKYIISAWIPEDITGYPANIQKEIENLKLSFLSQWGVSWEALHNGLTLVYRSNRGYGIYRNNSALPRAWIVQDYKVLPRDEILPELMRPDFKPDSIVLLEQKPNEPQTLNPNPQTPNTVNIIKYTPNKIVCEAELSAPGILVFSDNWHPDWKVYVDGKKDKLYVADLVARAVVLPTGKHKVEFVYESLYFKTGAIISIIAFLVLLLSCIIYYRSKLKHKKI